MLHLVLSVLIFSSSTLLGATVRWTMVNVNAREQQGDAHLVRLGEQTVLIDTGAEQEGLVDYLRASGVKKIGKIIITHGHKDHYGALLKLAESGIAIGGVWMNLPARATCDREKPWGCDHDDLAKLEAGLKELKIKRHPLKRGQIFLRADKAKLEVLYAYDEKNTPLKQTDVNDLSAIIKLTNGPVSALLTGDLNHPLGEYLARQGKRLESDILKVPHHGTESVAPNVFFDKVAAKIALVPSPKGLWLSERSKRVREYFEAKKTPVYVNGIHGHITVELDGKSYKIRIQNPDLRS